MNAKQRAGSVLAAFLAAILGVAALSASPSVTPPAGPSGAPACIVLLGDPHLPFKTTQTPDPAKGAALVKAKEAVIEDINRWPEVSRVVALGDITGTTGSEAEYRFARDFLGKLTAPFVAITGNHDYIYEDETRAGNLVRDKPATRAEKLVRFASTFGLPALQREETLAGYELIYLSTDSLDPRQEVGISEASLAWLEGVLDRTRTLPTIIFFHAPLAGTLLESGRPSLASSRLAAQPSGSIKALLKRHPQVFLWVSGHSHTQPDSPSYISPINLYEGHVLDIHCGDLGHQRIYTNTLWLYPGHVLVRTFDHGSGSYLPDKDRTIQVP